MPVLFDFILGAVGLKDVRCSVTGETVRDGLDERRPAPATRTVATTLSRCTSSPAQRSTTRSIRCLLPQTTGRAVRRGLPLTILRFALEAAVNDPAGPRAILTIGLTAPRRCRRRPIRRRHSHPATVAAAPPELLTMELLRQPMATGRNGFGSNRRFSPLTDLPLIATGCNHGAP